MKPRLFILGAIVLLIAGCVGSPPVEQTPPQTILPTQTPLQVDLPTQTPSLLVLPTQTPPLQGLPTQTLTIVIPEMIRPTARPDLEASDPAEFNLAAGKLQLIEFFAYW